MRKKMVSAVALATAMLLGSAPAAASITVNFTFAGNASEPGTVTGHLTFDGAGAGVAATGLYIDSATGDVNPPVSGYQGYNFLSGGGVYGNSFTVSDAGVITAASLYVYSTHAYSNVARNYIELNYGGGYNLFEQDYAQYYNGGYFRAIQNQGGLAGVTYAAPTDAVPEPASWAMLIVGFGLAGATTRRRTRLIAKVAYAA